MLRIVESVVQADESVAVCVIAVNLVVYRIESVVIAAVAVFCFVVDNRIFDFNAAGREVSLEVRAVVLSVPETPFSERPEFESLV